MKYLTPRNTSIAISAFSLITILVIIVTQTKSLLYDEHIVVPNIHLIEQLGLTKKFLLNMSGSPGPTYALIHYFFLNLTHFSVIGLRLTNFGLLLLLLYFIYLSSKLLKAGDPIIIVANFMVIPMVWVSCGLALTEIPAMLCGTISLYALLQCFIIDHKFISRVAFAILAGMFLSFSILARSFFLMMAVAIPIYLLIRFLLVKFDYLKSNLTPSPWILPGKNQSLILILVFLTFSLYLPLKVFMIWGALAPPNDTVLMGAGDLVLVPWYGVLSFCYCSYIALILAPGWFVIDKRLLIASLSVASIFLVINVYKGYFEFAPFLTASIKYLSRNGFNIYQRVIPAFIFLFAFHFLLSSAIRLWQKRNDPVFTFIGLLVLLIAFSAIKVKAQFSSRYVGQITPFFLLLFIQFERTTWLKVIRVGIGTLLGFVSLYFYYAAG